MRMENVKVVSLTSMPMTTGQLVLKRFVIRKILYWAQIKNAKFVLSPFTQVKMDWIASKIHVIQRLNFFK